MARIGVRVFWRNEKLRGTIIDPVECRDGLRVRQHNINNEQTNKDQPATTRTMS